MKRIAIILTLALAVSSTLTSCHGNIFKASMQALPEPLSDAGSNVLAVYTNVPSNCKLLIPEDRELYVRDPSRKDIDVRLKNAAAKKGATHVVVTKITEIDQRGRVINISEWFGRGLPYKCPDRYWLPSSETKVITKDYKGIDRLKTNWGNVSRALSQSAQVMSAHSQNVARKRQKENERYLAGKRKIDAGIEKERREREQRFKQYEKNKARTQSAKLPVQYSRNSNVKQPTTVSQPKKQLSYDEWYKKEEARAKAHGKTITPQLPKSQVVASKQNYNNYQNTGNKNGQTSGEKQYPFKIYEATAKCWEYETNSVYDTHQWGCYGPLQGVGKSISTAYHTAEEALRKSGCKSPSIEIGTNPPAEIQKTTGKAKDYTCGFPLSEYDIDVTATHNGTILRKAWNCATKHPLSVDRDCKRFQ